MALGGGKALPRARPAVYPPLWRGGFAPFSHLPPPPPLLLLTRLHCTMSGRWFKRLP